MTEKERTLIREITKCVVPGEEMALCGSIQNYRRHEHRNKHDLSFKEAAKEWEENIFTPIVTTLKDDSAASIAVGHDFAKAFFPALYAVENNNFRFDRNLVRTVAMKKAHGFRALLSKLIA